MIARRATAIQRIAAFSCEKIAPTNTRILHPKK
jgi:hypothetical protein